MGVVWWCFDTDSQFDVTSSRQASRGVVIAPVALTDRYAIRRISSIGLVGMGIYMSELHEGVNYS